MYPFPNLSGGAPGSAHGAVACERKERAVSVQATTAVWGHSQARNGARLVLLVIADHAHADGTGCYTSVGTMADQAKLSVRGTQEATRWLQQHGELVVDEGKGPNGTNLYSVRLPGMAAMDRPPQNLHPAESRPDSAPEPPITELPDSPNGESGPTPPVQQELAEQPKRQLTPAEVIADRHAVAVLQVINQGRAFNLTAELEEAWTGAWQQCVDEGLNPKPCGIRLLGYFYTALTEERPAPKDYGKLGALIGRWGKLALWGLDAALRRGIDDWLPYAQEVCARLWDEQQARRRARSVQT